MACARAPAPAPDRPSNQRAVFVGALFHTIIRTRTMSSDMYIQSVPVFKQMLNAMRAVLAKAEAHAAAHAVEPDAYLQARLFPDMFPLLKQVQIAADFARGVSARLAGVAVPGSEGQEKSFADLTAMLDESLVFLERPPHTSTAATSARLSCAQARPRSGSSSAKPIWPTTDCRSSSFTSPRSTPSCGTTAFKSARRTTWARTK